MDLEFNKIRGHKGWYPTPMPLYFRIIAFVLASQTEGLFLCNNFALCVHVYVKGCVSLQTHLHRGACVIHRLHLRIPADRPPSFLPFWPMALPSLPFPPFPSHSRFVRPFPFPLILNRRPFPLFSLSCQHFDATINFTRRGHTAHGAGDHSIF